jgi:L-gulonolactone oxidase
MQFHTDRKVQSWGRVGTRVHQVARPRFVEEVRQWNRTGVTARLPVGNLRSYSNVCLAQRGRLIDMTGLDRFSAFDPATGMLRAEAGITIGSVLETLVPLGFFVPVTPGTRFVTLGGAVANDVHGKNHHRAGTFGRHVRRLWLERSDEGTVETGPDVRPDLFQATIGGLGLTGIVTHVALQTVPIKSAFLDVESVPCDGLDELCDELEAGDAQFEHVVAWIDCTATGPRLGRGLVSRANWSDDGALAAHGPPSRSMPTDRLGGLLNPTTLKAFNALYHANGKLRAGTRTSHYEPFMYPLDRILHWNRLYGRRGFYQYQCVIPEAQGREPIREMLKEIADMGEGSFLAVLKRFGDRPSPGLLSFPMPGLTLALDFRNRGCRTLELFSRLDAIVEAAGGRLYAAKDQRIPPALFKRGHDSFERFCGLVDPRCRSDFWMEIRP